MNEIVDFIRIDLRAAAKRMAKRRAFWAYFDWMLAYVCLSPTLLRERRAIIRTVRAGGEL
jgi:hypothetical protein